MSEKIPSFNLYKKIENDLSVEFDRLEESYHEYDASHPHRHNYYEVLYFGKAGGYHEIDFRQFPVTANTIHFVSPEQVHLLRRKKEVTGFVLSFTADSLVSIGTDYSFLSQFPFFDISSPEPLIHLDEKDNEYFLRLISQIESEFNRKDEGQQQMLSLLIGQLLIFCKRNYRESESSSAGKTLTWKFRDLINSNFRKIKSVNEYAGLLNITSGHLSETVQKHTGKTAGELIHERIILEAKRLLYHSSLSVKEIAAELNYEDPSYFNRFFKTNCEQTPEQFRKAIREKYH